MTRLIPDHVSAAYSRRMVALATRDAFNAGRAMTLMAVHHLPFEFAA